VSANALAGSLARRLRLVTVAFADRWIPATSAGMTSNLSFNGQAKRRVIPGLVPGIQVSANALAGSLARRLRLVTVAFGRRISATSAGMTSNLRFNRQAKRRVIPDLVPRIQVSANALAGSLARRLRLATLAFAGRWIPATSAGMTSNLSFNRQAKRRVSPGVRRGGQESANPLAGSLARRLRPATVAFADRWIPATSAGMTSNLSFNRQAKRRVIPGLVPGIQVSANSFAGSLARRLRLATVAFADRWIPATSAGMTSNLSFNRQAKRWVIPGLVPGIQVSANSFAGSLARRLRLVTVAFADRWIPATSAGMTSNLSFNRQAKRRVIPGLVPGIQVPANSFTASLARR